MDGEFYDRRTLIAVLRNSLSIRPAESSADSLAIIDLINPTMAACKIDRFAGSPSGLRGIAAAAR
jgi:hypothetical protein